MFHQNSFAYFHRASDPVLLNLLVDFGYSAEGIFHLQFVILTVFLVQNLVLSFLMIVDHILELYSLPLFLLLQVSLQV